MAVAVHDVEQRYRRCGKKPLCQLTPRQLDDRILGQRRRVAFWEPFAHNQWSRMDVDQERRVLDKLLRFRDGYKHNDSRAGSETGRATDAR